MTTTEYWDRTHLYEQVWQQPVSKLARTYGISDVALAKVCRRLKVPLPARGYWAKPLHRRPKRPPLQAMSAAPRLRRPTRAQSKTETLSPITEGVSESERAELAIVTRLESCRAETRGPEALEPDVLVTRTRRALSRGTTDGRKILRPRAGSTCLDVRVSKQTLDRALGVFDKLLATLRAEGFPVKVGGTGGQLTSVQILGQGIRIGLLENVRRIQLPNPSKPTDYFSSYYSRAAVRYEPTGDLYLQVWNSCRNVRKSWRDGKHQRLERVLHKVVAGMVRVAQAERREAEMMRRAAELYRIEEEFRQKRQAELVFLKGLIESEERRVRRLEEAAENWVRAKRIREYVIAFVRSKMVEGQQLVHGSALGKWAIWAMDQADRLDPLAASPPSVLDRKWELAGQYR
ncbi:MAG TPA: hypothetical protein VMT53_07870 [Terriglobales bacterium]|nr:hypothetical protein [Terriglobales bacterium]